MPTVMTAESAGWMASLSTVILLASAEVVSVIGSCFSPLGESLCLFYLCSGTTVCSFFFTWNLGLVASSVFSATGLLSAIWNFSEKIETYSFSPKMSLTFERDLSCI